MRWALKKYGVPYVRVRQTHRPFSFWRPHDKTIYLASQHWNVPSVLHESAHAIYDYYYGMWDGKEGPHNERWLGIYKWLLEESGYVPKVPLEAHIAAKGLPYSYMMTPAVLKRKGPATLK